MRTFLSVLTLCVSLAAADAPKIDGDWDWRMPSPFGETTAVLTAKSDAGKLTGTFAFTETRKLTIENGTIDGNKFKMTVKRDRPEGGSVVYEMAGTFEGGEMKGTAETDMFGQKATANWTAKRK
jgi:hypothetical protein